MVQAILAHVAVQGAQPPVKVLIYNRYLSSYIYRQERCTS